MIPIDIKIESLIHRSFIDFHRKSNVNVLIEQFMRYHQAGYQYKMIEILKGDVNEVILTAESSKSMNSDNENFLPFIRAEKLAALRLLDFNAVSGLATIERTLDNPNPKTTRQPMKLLVIHHILYFCVFVKGKDIFILIDTNYKQYHYELRKFFRSLLKQKKEIIN
jgi:hypothetical protein